MNDVKFVEVFARGHGSALRDYSLRTIYINPEHVVCWREDLNTSRLLSEGRLPTELDPRQTFTSVSLNKGTHGENIVVIGSVEEVEKKIRSSRRLLKG